MMKFLIKYYVRKKLLNLKCSKLGQILRADKTGFCRLSHILGSQLNTIVASCSLCVCNLYIAHHLQQMHSKHRNYNLKAAYYFVVVLVFFLYIAII